MIQLPDITQIASEISGHSLEPNRGGYTVTMREDPGAAAVLQRLAADDPMYGRLHLGWGSFRNLDIIAARQSTCAFIFDINRHQLRVWQVLADVVQDCLIAEELVKRLAALLPDQPRLRRFKDSVEEWLLSDLERPESWLSTNHRSRFEYIRDLFRAGNIGIASLDICDPGLYQAQPERSGFSRLASALDQLGNAEKIFTDTLYLSNIPYMLCNNSGFFGKSEWCWVSVAHDGSECYEGNAVLQIMWDNLQSVISPVTLTVQANQLAPGFSDEDPHWLTTVSTFQVAKARTSK
ncbi:MAG: hypothetical protein V3U88_02390 [Methylococcales bacterium]